MRLTLLFWLDLCLFISACALETVPFTGLILHEWIGLAVAVMIVAHLLASWGWIASATRAIFSKRSARARINYFLNFCLFACATGLIFSGILISEHAIPALVPVRGEDQPQWHFIHDRLSDAFVLLVGLHLAINWTWIAAAAGKIRKRAIPA